MLPTPIGSDRKPLSKSRILAAFAVALAADALVMALGPAGWAFFDEIVDVLAMGATVWLLGFHPLLLPTFLVELVPFVDMLPTWTACVGAVVLLRRRASSSNGGVGGPG